MHIPRRSFIQGMLGTSLIGLGAGSACSSAKPLPGPGTPPTPLPPGASAIEHIIVLTMENRSFDHFLGWLPSADGWMTKDPNVTYTDSSGHSYPPQNLGTDFTGCGHPVPNNSYGTPNLTAYDNGKMDGFLRVPGNDIYSIGYYTEADMPFLSAFAQAYTTYDHWFAPILAETFPNRMFLWAAQTDRLSNTYTPSNLTTIFDRLSSAGISHRYYFNNVPFLALWGFRYLFSTALFDDFLNDVSSGNLPAVSFVDPKFTELDDGLGNDDHPHSDIRNGDAFLAQVFHAVSTGPKWASTVLIVTFDEWGGFFDHVAPPLVVPANGIDTHLIDGKVLLGFRVPTIIASPFTRGTNRVDSNVYDHTSILKLIEWRWNLPPLTPRDAAMNNPATTFNFTSPEPSVPALPQPATVPALPCFLQGAVKPETPAAPESAPKSPLGGLKDAPATRQFLQNPKFQKPR
ncbi:MAG: phospholipase [Acidobacteriaceae bacterium]|nr:phospholipase [Acidobacteriaceae bacterium]